MSKYGMTNLCRTNCRTYGLPSIINNILLYSSVSSSKKRDNEKNKKSWFSLAFSKIDELTELTHIFRREIKVRHMVLKPAEPCNLPNLETYQIRDGFGGKRLCKP